MKKRIKALSRGSLFDIIKSKSGETLMEALVSILVFSILMVIIVTVIRSSLVITGNSLVQANAAQDRVNRLVISPAESGSTAIEEVNVSFNYSTPALSGINVDISHDVQVYVNDDGFSVFHPLP